MFFKVFVIFYFFLNYRLLIIVLFFIYYVKEFVIVSFIMVSICLWYVFVLMVENCVLILKVFFFYLGI